MRTKELGVYRGLIGPAARKRTIGRLLAGTAGCALLIFAGTPANAAGFTCTWNDGLASWGTAADWQNCNGGIPNNGSGNTFDVLVSSGTPVLSSSASIGSASISSTGGIGVQSGGVLTTTGSVSVSGSGHLGLDYSRDGGGNGGSTVTIGGDLTNSSPGEFDEGGVVVGNSAMTSSDLLSVTGNFNNTGGIVTLLGGHTGAKAQMTVGGAAPSTLEGNYALLGNSGGAVMQWGSGGITKIGDGSSNAGAVILSGSNAFAEVGATNSNSALGGLSTISSNGSLFLENGASVTTTTGLTINQANGNSYNLELGQLSLDGVRSPGGGAGGSSMIIGGNLVNHSTGPFNAGGVDIGSVSITAQDSLTVTGTFDNTGGITAITGGSNVLGLASIDVTGAAPSTLQGSYVLTGNNGGAALKWGSGGITKIGDGAGNAGDLILNGSTAFAEIGATNSNSALAGLATISNNGSLFLNAGASVTTTTGLTINSPASPGSAFGVEWGQLSLDGQRSGGSGTGGSSMTIGGNLVNNSTGPFNFGGVDVGNNSTTAADTLTVLGSFDNTGGITAITGGNNASASSKVLATGAAPTTLVGSYVLTANTGGAAMEWGSGGVTQIGDGASNPGDLILTGNKAYAEIGATNSNSALAGLTTIANNGSLFLNAGASVTTTTGLTINAPASQGSAFGVEWGQLALDGTRSGGNATGGSSMTIGGNLVNRSTGPFNAGGVDVGNSSTIAATTLTVHGTFDNTVGITTISGGNTSAAVSSIIVTGAAPGTLEGSYDLRANGGSAVMQWGSGGVTQIGDGASTAGAMILDGSKAFAEIGATNSNSALAGLSTISTNGTLFLVNGASLTTTTGLTINAANGGSAFGLELGQLELDGTRSPGNPAGGSTMTIGGNVVNHSTGPFNAGGIDVGNGGATAATTLNINGTLDNTGGVIAITGGQTAAGIASVNVSGAAPSTLAGSYVLSCPSVTGCSGSTGNAIIKWGSGGITQIGDGGSNAGNVILNGSKVFAEVGATNSNSALSGLTTINNNGSLFLANGATITTTGNLTINGGGSGNVFNVETDQLELDGARSPVQADGGSSMTVGGNLVNASNGPFNAGGIDIGNAISMASSDQMTVEGTLTNSGTIVLTGRSSGVTGNLTVMGGATNSGTVTVNGFGNLTVAGHDFVQTAGTTTVAANGTLAANNVVIQGGLLQGTGTVTGTLNNTGGTVAGGIANQLGTLTVNGTFKNGPAGIVAASIFANSASSSQIAVNSGNPVVLSGGTLRANLEAGSYAAGQTYTVMTFQAGAQQGLFGGVANGANAPTAGTTTSLGGGLIMGVVYNDHAGNIQLQVVNAPGSTAEVWNGGAGNWATGSQWSTSAAPQFFSDVTIGATSSGNVTLGQDATIQSLTVNNGNTLAYDNTTPATLSVGKTVTVNAGGAVSLGTSGDKLFSAGFNNSGTTTIGAGATLQTFSSATNTAGGQIVLTGGTLAAPGLSNGGTISGNGTLNTSISNNGQVTASGGTLTAMQGIQGPSGNISVSSGAALDLSQATTGSSAGTLADNGSLGLGSQSITVSHDYSNANFGTGNSFNNHAGVTGTGQILAAGTTTQALTGSISGGASATPTMAFGNVHVASSTTLNYQIADNGSGGASLRGAIQTGVNGGNLTDASLSGTGVTASNWGPVAQGSSTGNLSVTYAPTVAGALTGQSVHIANNFDNVAGQTLAITGAAYNYANPSAAPNPVAFGNHHVGDSVSQSLTITNSTISNPAFQEGLDVTVNGTSGGASTNGGAITNLAAGGSNSTSIVVAMNTSAAGNKAGTVTLGMTSDGGTTSGLGFTALPSQTVNVTGAAYDYASPTVNTTSVNFGNHHVGDIVAQQGVSITNTVITNAGFQEGLNATAGGTTGGVTTNGGGITNLAAGGTNAASITVGIDTSTAGSKNGTATINFESNGATTSGLGITSLASRNVTVTGGVYNLASSSTIAPINFGLHHVGDGPVTQNLSISNTAPTGSFSEGLDSSFGNFSGTGGSMISTTGSIANLAAGSTDSTSMRVTLDTSVAGNVNGTLTVHQASDGATTSGLGITALPDQNPSVTAQVATGTVVRFANPQINNAPVNFGNVRLGSTVTPQGVSVTNNDPNDGFSESLIGNVVGTSNSQVTASGGFGSPSANPELAPSATDSSSITVGIDTSSAGAKSGNAVIDFKSDGTMFQNGTVTDLGNTNVAVQGNVYRLANPTLNTPSVTLAARVGDTSPTASISMTNSSPDSFTEGLDASASTGSAGFTAGGHISNLAAQGTDATSLHVGLDTSTSGSFSGTATVANTSNGLVDNAAAVSVGSSTVALSGKVYQTASAGVTPSVDFGIVHVGDTVSSKSITVANNASGALTDVVTGGISSVSGGPFSGSGTLGAGVAAGSSSNALTVGLNTTTAGTFHGSANLSLASHDADLADVALSTAPVAVSAQVNNYAKGTVAKTGGAGNFSGSGADYVLDFGTLTQGSGDIIASFMVKNDVSGPADDLSGHFILPTLPADLNLTNFSDFANLAAGQDDMGLTATLDTSMVNAFDEFVTLDLTGSNDSGYSAALPVDPTITLELRGDVVASTGGGGDVPEPGTLALLGAGLAGLGWFGWRRSRKAQVASE